MAEAILLPAQDSSSVEAGPHRPRWPRVWLAFLALSALLTLSYLLLPAGLVGTIVYLVAGLLAPGAVLLGVHLHQPDRRRAWYLLAAGLLIWVGGTLVATVQAIVAPTEAYPTLADVFYLAGYPLLALSLYLLIRGRRPRRDVEGLLDSSTVTLGLYLLAWVLLAEPTFTRSAGDWLAAAVAAAYPLLDISLIALLVMLIVTPGTHTQSLRLLTTALAMIAIANATVTALGLLALGSTTPIDFIWLIGFVLAGAAGLHPSMYDLSRAVPAEQFQMSGRRRIATTVAVLVAPGTLAVQQAFGLGLNVWAVVLASAVMFLLVATRMNVAVRQILTADERRDQAQRELAHQASHDALTGLPNRPQSLEALAGTLSRAQRSGAMIGVLFVDLDDFKAVNDTFGHAAGDDVLRAVARRMQRVVRGGDMVGRLGGDEFVVLLEPVVDEESAVGVAQRLIAEVSAPIKLSTGQEVSVGASVGVAISQDAQTDPDALLVEADTAAYRAKALGRGRTEVFDTGLRRELQGRMDLENGLRAALKDDQLELRFRPVIDLTTRRPRGYEAVLHWNRPSLGLVAVPDFRPVAETTDLILDCDAWALGRVAAQIAELETAGFPGVLISVRVSVRHAARERIVEDVRSALETAGVAADLMMVQVSDTGPVSDPAVVKHLAQLRTAGSPIGLDDFGAGHSSVRRLARLPLDAVTFDSSLLDRTSSTTERLLELMVRGVQNFDLLAVVKGVQSEEDVRLLRRIGCNLAQGEYFGDLEDSAGILNHLRRDTVPA